MFLNKTSNEGYDLSVFFNLYCNTKKTVNDAVEMEAILKEELALRFPVTVHIDPASIEVRGKCPKFVVQSCYSPSLFNVSAWVFISSSAFDPRRRRIRGQACGSWVGVGESKRSSGGKRFV